MTISNAIAPNGVPINNASRFPGCSADVNEDGAGPDALVGDAVGMVSAGDREVETMGVTRGEVMDDGRAEDGVAGKGANLIFASAVF